MKPFLQNVRMLGARDAAEFQLAGEILDWAQAGDLLSAREAIADFRKEVRRVERERILAELARFESVVAYPVVTQLRELVTRLRTEGDRG